MAKKFLGKEVLVPVVVALVAGGSAPWWLPLIVGEPYSAESEALVRLGTINSTHPDYVELVTQTTHTIDISGYRICEHDAGEPKDSCYSVPQGSRVAPGSPFRVYFFSPKEPDKRAMAAAYRTQGLAVEERFAIAAQETVVLYSADGARLEEKRAR